MDSRHVCRCGSAAWLQARLLRFPNGAAGLPQPDASAAAVFVDELDPSGLQRFLYFFSCFTAAAERTVTRLQPLYRWDRDIGCFSKVFLRPPEKCAGRFNLTYRYF
jgi:hypothetical protein